MGIRAVFVAAARLALGTAPASSSYAQFDEAVPARVYSGPDALAQSDYRDALNTDAAHAIHR
jgi:hypothetical protein